MDCYVWNVHEFKDYANKAASTIPFISCATNETMIL